jgi:hypothetical protein
VVGEKERGRDRRRRRGRGTGRGSWPLIAEMNRPSRLRAAAWQRCPCKRVGKIKED